MANDAVQLVAACGGELVAYQAFNGTAKQFKAIVHRRPTQVQSVGGSIFGVNTIEVEFPRDATDGVLTVQPRKDIIRFKTHLSDPDVTEFTVHKLLSEDSGLVASDGGMFRIEVQA